MPVFLIPAIISALAAAGTGVAGAMQADAASKDAAAQSAAGRATQEKIAKMQIAAQREQQDKNLAQGYQQQLMGAYGQAADYGNQIQSRRNQAHGDAMSTIAKMYLGGR